MKLQIMVYLLFIASLYAYAEPPQNGTWKKIPELTDEFNQDQLDESKWHDHNPRWKGRKPGYFSPENVQVQNGELQLSAKAETLPNLPDGYHTFTTAAVKSKNRVLYGYFEIRFKPMRSHASSAFWFYAHDEERWTEIDVFEISGANPKHKRIYHTNAHVFYTPTINEHIQNAYGYETEQDLADDYHTCALEWNEKEIKWYLDGKKIRTLENKHWHQPLHLNFDSETMPNWFGLPKEEELPATFKIDYVRSWKQIEEPSCTATELQQIK